MFGVIPVDVTPLGRCLPFSFVLDLGNAGGGAEPGLRDTGLV